MSDRATIAVYDAKAAEYAGLTEKLYELAEVEAFAAALPDGGKVLDLGAGPGFYAEWLAQRGFDAEAWDASAEMVRLALARGVNARQAQFTDLDANGIYDGVWANFSLLHLPKAEFPAVLARIRRAGKPGMAFHIGMKLGQGEGPDKIGRFYAYYEEPELDRHLTAAGFDVVHRRHGKGPGLSGEVSPYITMLARA